jgi:hypothetical protein
MIGRLQATMACDVRLQFRNGFYYATLAVTLFSVLIIRLLPARDLSWLLPAIIVNNVIVTGFYFLSGLVLLEKGEGSLEAQIVTPLRPREYLGSKVATLVVLSLCESMPLALAMTDAHFQPGLMMAGIALGTTLFALTGFVAVTRYDSINAFLLPSALVVALLALPLLHYFGVGDGPLVDALMWLHPLQPTLLLLVAALSPTPAPAVAAALALGLAWIAFCAWLATRAFHQFVVERVAARPRQKERQMVNRELSMVNGAVAAPVAHAPGSDQQAGARSPVTRHFAFFTQSLGPIDAKSVQRDELLRWLIFAPFLLALAVRWVLPILVGAIQEWLGVDISAYYPPVMGFIVLLMTPYLWGAVFGFLLLDQRDDQTLTALQVTPLSARQYLAYRLGMPALLAGVTTLLMLPITGLFDLPWWTYGVLALSVALMAPLTALALATLAQNKVQGLALMKAAGIVLFPPVVAYFVAQPWQWLLAILPTWWPAQVLWHLQAGDNLWVYFLAGSLVFFSALLWLLARRFDRVMHR